MAQTKRKRKRKHRGTQGGSVNRRRTGRPRSRQEAKAQARRQSQDRRDLPPSWGSSINRALIGGLIFFAILVLLFGQPVGGAIGLAVVMTAIYVPMGYYMDRFFYRRRTSALQRRREAEKNGR